MLVDEKDSGLTYIDEFDYDEEAYQFNLIRVWRNAAGELVYATDSGCSCPTPFEGCKVEDLVTLTPGEWKHIKRQVKVSSAAMSNKDAFIKVIEEALAL